LLLFPIKDNLKNSLLPEGKIEEILIYLYDQILTYHLKDDKIYEKFEKWRDSHGLIKPVEEDAFTFAEINPSGTNYLKYIISFESYIEKEGKNWKEAFLTFLNSKRVGEIKNFKINSNENIKISKDYYFINLIK
jgi:hypothetical protein